ncbi:MAG TPA: GGDEF domain-containing protein [Campylobacterales bacterium]|nr:GGDEF domain-containing protein [Campylobacterales bacterium]
MQWMFEEPWLSLTLGSLLLLVLIVLIARHCIYRYNYAIDRFMELTNNIMVITDKEEILKVNHTGLNFFGFRTIEEMKQDHKYIAKFFEEVQENITEPKVIHGKRWVVDVTQKNIQDIKIKMKQFDYCEDPSSVLEQYFNLRVSRISPNRYFLTFNNVTGLVREKVSIQARADHDTLTGIYNRLKFNELFGEMLGRGMHFDENFSVILFDIDHFKSINDEKGHAVGDSVLRELARLVKLQMRKNDVLARWGGEEFVILSRFTTDVQAKRFADRLRKEIQNYHFDHMDRAITCSFGVTQYESRDDSNTIFERADKALYEAKKQGRNRVILV